MSELVVRAEAQGALPPEEVAVALGAPGGLTWIEAPWELAEAGRGRRPGRRVGWNTDGNRSPRPSCRPTNQELHFQSADGRLEGRIQFRSRADKQRHSGELELSFPVSGGGMAAAVAALAVMRGNMEKLAGEETTKGLKRLLDNGAPPRPEKKAAATAPAPTPVDAALTVSPGAQLPNSIRSRSGAPPCAPGGRARARPRSRRPPPGSTRSTLGPAAACRRTALALYPPRTSVVSSAEASSSFMLWFLRIDGGPATAGDRRLYMGIGSKRDAVRHRPTAPRLLPGQHRRHADDVLAGVAATSASSPRGSGQRGIRGDAKEAKLFEQAGGEPDGRRLVDGEQRGGLVLKLKRHLGGKLAPELQARRPGGPAAPGAIARHQLELERLVWSDAPNWRRFAGQLRPDRTNCAARFAS